MCYDKSLPVKYKELTWQERKAVRELYVELQDGLCYWCRSSLKEQPPQHILIRKINWKLFPENFLKYPVHLQHCHKTGWTEGAVHAYCNAVMWQYYKR